MKKLNIFWYRYALNKDQKKVLASSPTGANIYTLRERAIKREQAWQLHKVLIAGVLIACCISVGYYFPQYISLGNSTLVGLVIGICIMFFTTLSLSKYMRKDSVMQQYAEDFFQIYSTLEVNDVSMGFLENMLS